MWAASMAASQNIGVPWIICKQFDAPESVVRSSILKTLSIVPLLGVSGLFTLSSIIAISLISIPLRTQTVFYLMILSIVYIYIFVA